VAEILLAVSGGIAAYKSLDVLRILQRRGHRVRVVMSRNATRFVGPASFAALSGREVGLRLFGGEDQPGYDHLDLAREADLMLVCPASANTVARLATGFGDGLIPLTFLAFTGPVLVAPAMNTRMLDNAATIENLQRLAARGIEIIPTATGLLADGDTGAGRLADPVDICDAVDRSLAGRGSMAGVRVLVTAGGTREPIDAVRFVGNRSSGRMAWAIADEARRRGAEVTVIVANVDLPRRSDVRYVDAPTAHAMHETARDAFKATDVLVMAAAVADYRPVTATDGKIDKSQSDALAIPLERTADILTDLASRRDSQTMVGFAAEHGEAGLARAREKRTRKGVDIVVHNDVSVAGIGFESADNAITLIGPGDHETALPRMSKAACAVHILDAIATVRLAAPDA
jgi:phosphopantothenoylcysteine decarboxylase / phosphopantothenate---cysteine ligase